MENNMNMENNMLIKTNEMFGDLRIVMVDNDPWFVGKDITTALGYSNASKALLDHVDEEDKLNNVTLSSLGQRGGWLINESGLYSLILKSKLPEAKQFKRWVTSEVLPSIRKDGGYIATNSDMSDEEIMAKALVVAQKTIERKNLELQEQKKIILEQQPKVEFYDDVAGSKDAVAMKEVAKVLGIKGMGRNKLFKFLRDKKILDRNNMPYQEYVDRGYFRVIEQRYNTNNGDIKITFTTLVYNKGIEYIRKLLK